MYLDHTFARIGLSLSEITSLFGLCRYLDRTFAQRIGSAKVKSKIKSPILDMSPLKSRPNGAVETWLLLGYYYYYCIAENKICYEQAVRSYGPYYFLLSVPMQVIAWRTISGMTYNVSSGTLNLTHSLTQFGLSWLPVAFIESNSFFFDFSIFSGYVSYQSFW